VVPGAPPGAAAAIEDIVTFQGLDGAAP